MKLFWKLYSFLFFAIVTSSAMILLNKNSLFGIYYNTTIIFSSWFIIPYLLNVLNALLGCIVCVYIFGYAFDIKALSHAPKWLFYLRLFSDLTGHSYELNMILSSFTQGALVGTVAFASLALPILPSYLAQWRMTFKK